MARWWERERKPWESPAYPGERRWHRNPPCRDATGSYTVSIKKDVQGAPGGVPRFCEYYRSHFLFRKYGREYNKEFRKLNEPSEAILERIRTEKRRATPARSSCTSSTRARS